jgi:hypothetical protein
MFLHVEIYGSRFSGIGSHVGLIPLKIVRVQDLLARRYVKLMARGATTALMMVPLFELHRDVRQTRYLLTMPIA